MARTSNLPSSPSFSPALNNRERRDSNSSSDIPPSPTFERHSNETHADSTPSTSTELPPPRGVSEIIGQSLASFDAQSELVDPYIEEGERDVETREKLQEMLIDLVLECHAWSNVRALTEHDHLATALQKETASLTEIEQEQGRFSRPPSLAPSFGGRRIYLIPSPSTLYPAWGENVVLMFVQREDPRTPRSVCSQYPNGPQCSRRNDFLKTSISYHPRLGVFT